ncbi:MAG: hypothetical protein IT232_04905 [Flavobacteriales bacterium]|nr:hypothetical protein [Flavobacteriales bacterium]
MALHLEKVGLLKESLQEMIHLADYAVTYKKTDRKKWGANATGGILGFPSTVILFSIIDCLGSVFSGDKKLKIIIDAQERQIKDTSQHIFILNSKYYNLDLSLLDLENIYKNVRSTLTHNSLMPEGYNLQVGDKEKSPFKIAINELDNRIYFINLIPLFNLTKKAVENFIKDLDSGDINFLTTKVHTTIEKRDAPTIMYYDIKKPGEFQMRIKKWVKE